MQQLINPVNTQAWEANQKRQITSEGFVELSYQITDPGLPNNEAFDNGVLPRLPQTAEIMRDIDRAVIRYATLEQNLWFLDGSLTTIPDTVTPGFAGFISNRICNEHGIFETPTNNVNPIIRIIFEEMVTSTLPGLTITWSTAFEDYPVSFKITAYRDNFAYPAKVVTDNTNVTTVTEYDMTNFNRIEIEVIEWNLPYRRARIERIFLGIRTRYDKSALLRFSATASTDPLCGSLPKYEIQFELDNRDDAFNPSNPDGMTKYMMERQELRARYGFMLDDGVPDWLYGGVYYLSDWSAAQNGLSASFKARDLLGFMNAPYHKGVYEPRGVTLHELAERVLTDARLPVDTDGSNMWVLDNVLRTFTTVSPLPSLPMSECLQLIANASGCTIFADRRGRLHIKPFDTSTDSIDIDDDRSYTKAEINLSKPVSRFEISSYSYTEDTRRVLYSERLTLNQGRNEFILEYSDLAKDVIGSITINDSGNTFTLAGYCNRNCGSGCQNCFVEYYASCCILRINSASAGATCDITISGTVLNQSEKVIVTTNPLHPTGGETQTLRNSLITCGNHARRVGNLLKDRLNHRKNYSFDWRVDPRVEVGDIANVQNGSALSTMRLTSSNFTFNGAFKGKCEGVEIA